MSSAAQQPTLLLQLDVIAIDVSGSMKCVSCVDPLQTREDVSKTVFHTMVDKMLCLEMDHAVGLLAFGESLTSDDLTVNYENFHTSLGRLDANQPQTKLFNAILESAEQLLAYRAAHADEVAPDAPLRIFALTDGEDNGSTVAPWTVAKMLQENNIILDVFPMATSGTELAAISAATGGMNVTVTSVEEGIAMFEREALVHVPSRSSDPDTEIAAVIRNPEDFFALLNKLDAMNSSSSASGGATSQVTAAAAIAPTKQAQQAMSA